MRLKKNYESDSIEILAKAYYKNVIYIESTKYLADRPRFVITYSL